MVVDAKHVAAEPDINLCRLGSRSIHKAIISHCYPLIDNPLQRM
jgi:hypothetical protein